MLRRAASSQSQTSRTAPWPPARVVTRSAAARASWMRVGHRDAEARRGEHGRIGRVVTHAGAVVERDTARLREFAQRGELVADALGDVADAELARAPRDGRATCGPR